MNAKIIGAIVTASIFAIGGGYYFLSSGGAPGFVPSFQLTAGSCRANEQIPADLRAEIEAVAINMVETLAKDPTNFRKLMSRRGRAETAQEGSIEAAAAQYNSVPATSAPEVSDTFLQENTSRSDLVSASPCNSGKGTTMVARGSTPRSALILVNQQIEGGSRLTSQVLLEQENNKWRARGLHFMLTSLNNLESSQLLAQAKEQRAKGNLINAHMLAFAAGGTLMRGPFYEDPEAKALSFELRDFKAPEIMQGDPPFGWMLDGEYFSVKLLKYEAMREGGRQLVIYHTASDAKTYAIADSINRRLIAGFDSAHPEWRDVFDILSARTDIPNTSMAWTTGYSREDGFIPIEIPAGPPQALPQTP
jgi:hypothetical protein